MEPKAPETPGAPGSGARPQRGGARAQGKRVSSGKLDASKAPGRPLDGVADSPTEPCAREGAQQTTEQDAAFLLGIIAEAAGGAPAPQLQEAADTSGATLSGSTAAEIQKCVELAVQKQLEDPRSGVQQQVHAAIQKQLEDQVGLTVSDGMEKPGTESSRDLDALINRQFESRGIDAIIERRVREVADVRVVAGAAALDIVSHVEQAQPQKPSTAPAGPMAPAAEPEPPPSPTTYAPMVRRPVTSGARDKSQWTAGRYNSVASAPHSDWGAMEDGLVERVLLAQPQQAMLGFTDVLVRDLATSVVRDIVGIMETLLDRLLTEKKQDTLRSMVAELMTEDLAATIALSCEKTTRREMGHLADEMARVRNLVHDSELSWEERFSVTEELRHSQDDMWTTVDERFSKLEARVADMASDFAPRAELEARVGGVAEEFGDIYLRVGEAVESAGKIVSDFAEFRGFCSTAYATKEEAQGLESRVFEEASKRDADLGALKHDIMEHSASAVEHAALREEYDDAQRRLTTGIFEAKTALDSLETRFGKVQRMNDANFCTKLEFETGASKANEDRETLERSLRQEVADLEAQSATKRALEEVHSYARKVTENIQEDHALVVNGLDKAVVELRVMKEKCDTFATKEYCYSTAEKLAHRVATECDEKETIAELRREFEEAHERVRQVLRQQQQVRRDISFTSEQVSGLQAQNGALLPRVDTMAQTLDCLDVREAEHFAALEVAARTQRQAHDELQERHAHLDGEVQRQGVFQKSEGERLLAHSTHRYLEQMDKALGLQGSIERVELGHRELSETMRTIKLPKL